MTDRLTREQVAELRRLHKAATAGPWERMPEHIHHQDLLQDTVVAGDGKSVCDTLNASHRELTYDDGWYDSIGAANMCLIAATRNALPALLSAAEELNRLTGALGWLDKTAFACASALDPRKPSPHSDTESWDDFSAQGLVSFAEQLGWKEGT